MARIGAFGETVFSVSSWACLTFDGYKRTVKHEFATHKVHNHVSVLESVGRPPQEVSMEIVLMTALGVNPREEANRLRQMCLDGEPNYLIIGDEAINGSRFVLESLDEEVKAWTAVATPQDIKLKLKLKEYTEIGT